MNLKVAVKTCLRALKDGDVANAARIVKMVGGSTCSFAQSAISRCASAKTRSTAR